MFWQILAIFTIAYSQCPVWQCEQAGPGYCYERNGDVINANNTCQYQEGCKLFNYVNNVDTLACVPAPAKSNSRQLQEDESDLEDGESRKLYGKLSETLKSSYCKDKNWLSYLKCDNFCVKRRTCYRQLFGEERNLKKSKTCHTYYDCDFSDYLVAQQPSVNPAGQLDWAVCSSDSECYSNSCKCTASFTSHGRCETSIRDTMYRQFFDHVCVDRSALEWDTDACAYFILVKIGHFIDSLQVSEQFLPCLKAFGDFNDYGKVHEELKDTAGLYFGLIITVLICCCCCGVCYQIAKQSKKKEHDKVKLTSEAAKESTDSQFK